MGDVESGNAPPDVPEAGSGEEFAVETEAVSNEDLEKEETEVGEKENEGNEDGDKEAHPPATNPVRLRDSFVAT